ncbi:MAG TPA: enoyl-CoA hydratase/isomerase family protein, partial [Deltaproteobacteria bacterium]|nr:enoyl-CoA hydratase/isomerase family protein [Deltaproteobacteria bacterium]
MGYQFIKADIEGQIALIEMDRKRELNALSFGMMREIHHVFARVLHETSEARVIVFTGGDECFSAGIDLKEAPGFTPEEAANYFRLAVEVYTMLLDQDKILISAVSGIAFGGGFNLALMGDMIIASESAIFAHPEIKYGFNPLLAPLVARIGIARARELALRGDPVGAREAYTYGLVNRVVEPERFRDEVMACAAQLVGRPPEVVR